MSGGFTSTLKASVSLLLCVSMGGGGGTLNLRRGAAFCSDSLESFP